MTRHRVGPHRNPWKDGAKRTVGRERHIAVDTDGRLPMAGLTPANVSDSAGAKAVPHPLRRT